MRANLKTVSDWNVVYMDQNLIELVKNLKALYNRYEGHRKPTMALVRAK